MISVLRGAHGSQPKWEQYTHDLWKTALYLCWKDCNELNSYSIVNKHKIAFRINWRLLFMIKDWRKECSVGYYKSNIMILALEEKWWSLYTLILLTNLKAGMQPLLLQPLPLLFHIHLKLLKTMFDFELKSRTKEKFLFNPECPFSLYLTLWSFFHFIRYWFNLCDFEAIGTGNAFGFWHVIYIRFVPTTICGY